VILTVLGFEIWASQLVASRYTDYCTLDVFCEVTIEFLIFIYIKFKL